MPERIYMNRRTGERRIHVEITATEIADILNDFAQLPAGVTAATEQLYALLVSANLTLSGVKADWE